MKFLLMVWGKWK